MPVTGVGDCGEREEARVEVLEVGQLRFVEREIGARHDLARHEGARGGHHDVKAGMPGEELGLEHLVAVVDVVGNGDSGFLLEIRDRVGGDVIRPIVDVEPLFLGPRAPSQQREREPDQA